MKFVNAFVLCGLFMMKSDRQSFQNRLE